MVKSATARTFEAARSAYDAARQDATRQFGRSNRVEPFWKALTAATDHLITQAVSGLGVTVVAVGGYGRGELYPYSDIDLLMLISAEHGAVAEQASMQALQRLWDLGLAASHATRTVQETVEAAQADASIATALMDARLVSGDTAMFRQLAKRLKQEVFGTAATPYIATKLGERDARHAKWGDSRFMLEPQIKEGKGALRDLQTLRWISDFCAEHGPLLSVAEWQSHRAAMLFFSVIRAHMQVLRGRADERFTFDLQMEIATRLKFPGKTPQQKAERLMRRYFQFTRVTGVLTRSLCAALEDKNLRATPLGFSKKSETILLPPEFALEGGRLTLADPDALKQDTALVMRLFSVAAQHGLDLHPHVYLAIDRALPVLSRQLMFEGEANRLFMQILTGKSPELHLRRMNESGVLGALLPEFERITGMMQYDGYHTYTVDEHMLVAVGNLAEIEQGKYADDMPIATRIAHEIGEREVLYLAVLCHDLAKGSGGAHAEKGEQIAARIAQRMGIGAQGTELAGWLIKHQELLSSFAFKRNLDDVKTISDFVEIVQSPERLRLLLLLTVSDIKAVGPSIWNGWKGALMRTLYTRGMAAMGVGAVEQRAALSPAEAAMMSAWEKAPEQAAIHLQHDTFRAVTEIVCCTSYTPTVFRNLAGVLAYAGASIVSARIQIVDGLAALMHVGIQDVAGNSFAEEDARLAQLVALLAKAETGQLELKKELPRRRKVKPGRDVAVEPAVFIDNQVSAEATVIEVNARDRLGLVYDILGGMREAQLQVISAQLATYGNKAVDVFYVKNQYGHKIVHEAKLVDVQRALLAVLAGAVQDAADD